MNPRSLLAQHLPTLTEVVDEASIVERGIGLPNALSNAETTAASFVPSFVPSLAASLAPIVDLSDEVHTFYRTPTPQEVERLRGDDAPFEATISDHEIRRALAEAEANARAVEAEPIDVSLADEYEPAYVPVATAPSPVDEAQLSERVLADVQRQVDALLEHRLREALAPLLAQVADTLAVQAREVLASSLRDLVSQAVTHEIERQRGR